MINALGPSEALIVAPLELAFAKIAGKKVAASASLVTDGLPGRSVSFRLEVSNHTVKAATSARGVKAGQQ